MNVNSLKKLSKALKLIFLTGLGAATTIFYGVLSIGCLHELGTKDTKEPEHGTEPENKD